MPLLWQFVNLPREEQHSTQTPSTVLSLHLWNILQLQNQLFIVYLFVNVYLKQETMLRQFYLKVICELPTRLSALTCVVDSVL